MRNLARRSNQKRGPKGPLFRALQPLEEVDCLDTGDARAAAQNERRESSNSRSKTPHVTLLPYWFRRYVAVAGTRL